VVPAQRRDQFRPERHDGKIIGRGTADMKGGLVSMIYGAAAARELGLLGHGRIVLHFVCDEETGSAVGSGHLREAGLIDSGALAMLTAEPTGGAVWHASRGAITMRVAVQGRARRTWA
jgi:succinyl-diaminopimelate desuccinylase